MKNLADEDTNQNVLSVETAPMALASAFSTDTLTFGEHDDFACATVPDSTLLETNTIANTGLKQIDAANVVYTMTVLMENVPSTSGQIQCIEDTVVFTHTGRSESETAGRANSPQGGFEDVAAVDNVIRSHELNENEATERNNN